MAAPPEVSEAWLTIVTAVGGALAAGGAAWLKSYAFGRSEEAEAVHIPGRAVGAAFVDRSAADMIAHTAEDVRVIRRGVEDLLERDDKDRFLAEARRVAREEARRVDDRDG